MSKIHILAMVFSSFLVGCSVAEEVDKETRSTLRAIVSTQLAKSVMENPVIDKDEDEELCDGSGYITHGDGHRTKCPGCSACKATEQVSVEQKDVRFVYHFGATWCAPCEKMKSTTWKDADLIKYMKDNDFKLYYMDVDKQEDKQFFKYYNVNSFPTLMVLDEDNLKKPLHRTIGYKGADSVESILKGLK